MTRFRTGRLLALLTVPLLLLLGGCSDNASEKAALEPVAFHASDECHVCGMVIAGFPGPKGQAVAADGVRKFCSTAEMMGWWLQPENQTRRMALYVHDMARSDWNRPDDSHLIDARSAWYVAGTGLPGAMGKVLASFSTERDARALATREGGSVMRFDEITQAFLSQPAAQVHAPAMSHDDH